MNSIHYPISRLVRLLLPMLFIAAGCVTVPKPTVANVPHLPENSTYLLHIPGVSGVTLLDTSWLNQLQGVGATDHWEIYEWVGDRKILQAVREVDENHRIAGEIADYLTAVHRANPRTHLVLASESAGTALAVWTLEQLPPDVHVRSALLVAPDLSPGYDLSAAMAHVDHHLFYTTTPLDFGTLGFWSRIVGNMDGVKNVGAGWVGFRAPAGADAVGYRRVVRIRWQIPEIFTGYLGNHSGGLAALYGRFVLGPVLVKDAETTSNLSR
jgi:hypothetical protein